eukprot:GAHX01002185.1.p1 GENE.GAHX01002185.1~~GAHX01002185.1.p1  ORF type:complete len:284 (-),score=43.57 GAHX01002185.1:15-866(-)
MLVQIKNNSLRRLICSYTIKIANIINQGSESRLHNQRFAKQQLHECNIRKYTNPDEKCFICCKNKEIETDSCLLCNYGLIFENQSKENPINIFELFNTTPSIKICMKELRNKYANLARIYNPDRYLDDGLDLSNCQKISSEVNNAYNCLKSDVCRVEQFLKYEFGIEIQNVELDSDELKVFYNDMLAVNEEIANNTKEKEIGEIKDFLILQRKYYLREIQKLTEMLNLAEHKQLNNHKHLPLLPIQNVQKLIATSFSKVKTINRTILNLGNKEKNEYLNNKLK